jgi:hypothetical protein
MKNFLAFLFFYSLFCSLNAQYVEPIDVADIKIKIGIGKVENLYYSFNEGDQIVFSFETQNGTTVKTIEIFEYPNNSKYKDFQTSKVEDKMIFATNKGVYHFKIHNANLFKAAICKVKIQRIPANIESIKFNTSVQWVQKIDTTYKVSTKNVTVGYNNYEVQKTRQVLESTDTSLVSVLERKERVHSQTALSGSNTSRISFNLPANTVTPAFNPNKTTEVLNWVYTIEVANNNNSNWNNVANQKAAAKLAARAGTALKYITAPQAAVFLLAVEGVSMFSNPPDGDNINFSIKTNINNQTYTLAYGNSVTASGRIDNVRQGGLYIDLANDNIMNGIDVNVNIFALIVTKQYKDEQYTIQKSDAIKEKQTIKKPKVKARKIPTTIE